MLRRARNAAYQSPCGVSKKVACPVDCTVRFFAPHAPLYIRGLLGAGSNGPDGDFPLPIVARWSSSVPPAKRSARVHTSMTLHSIRWELSIE
jgi:hypothetical protein